MLPNTNKVEVRLSYGELSPVIQWCERNCYGEWSYEINEPPGIEKGEYDFYFEHEKDFVAFTIWNK